MVVGKEGTSKTPLKVSPSPGVDVGLGLCPLVLLCQG